MRRAETRRHGLRRCTARGAARRPQRREMRFETHPGKERASPTRQAAGGSACDTRTPSTLHFALLAHSVPAPAPRGRRAAQQKAQLAPSALIGRPSTRSGALAARAPPRAHNTGPSQLNVAYYAPWNRHLAIRLPARGAARGKSEAQLPSFSPWRPQRGPQTRALPLPRRSRARRGESS